jgi:2-phospho-L-lactate guanylyltransferase
MRAALIPMKELAQAKMRLAGELDAAQRAEFALAMLTDVLAACTGSGCFDVIAVVSNDNAIFEHIRELGAEPLAEPATISGLNDSLALGQRYLARTLAVDELVVLPADIPLARAEDLRAVVAALAGGDAPRAVLVRSRDNGTNALAMRPPEAVSMHFGRNSADAHRAAAETAGIEVVEIDNFRLAYDIDAPEDLAALPALAAGAATRGWLEARSAFSV